MTPVTLGFRKTRSEGVEERAGCTRHRDFCWRQGSCSEYRTAADSFPSQTVHLPLSLAWAAHWRWRSRSAIWTTPAPIVTLTQAASVPLYTDFSIPRTAPRLRPHSLHAHCRVSALLLETYLSQRRPHSPSPSPPRVGRANTLGHSLRHSNSIFSGQHRTHTPSA